MTVTCTAPLTSLLIDTNKGVRPCCYYQDGFIGNLKNQSIPEIIKSDRWIELKQQMKDGAWPNGCFLCKKNETDMGNSLRQVYFENTSESDIQDEKITYIEFNGSNICNLACVHCHSLYSSKWYIERKKTEKVANTYDQEKQKRIFKLRPLEDLVDSDGTSLIRTHLPNPELVLENLKQLDLTQLKTISFRGGEPLLNSETAAVLGHVDQQGVLDKINVSITTNGTYVNQDVIELLKKCKTVHINLSIDGVGELFNYIRYGDSKFESIEPTVAKLNEIPNIGILVSVAPMNYNAFSLVAIRDWTLEMSSKYKGVQKLAGFSNCVVSPEYLSLTTLSDNTRKYLIDYYTANSIEDEFKYVINLLSNAHLGFDVHRQWVEYTELLETVRGNSIITIVPQLETELKMKYDR